MNLTHADIQQALERAAESRGKADFLKGIPSSKNPYDLRTQNKLHRGWALGWEKASKVAA